MKFFLFLFMISLIDSLKVNKYCVNCKHFIQDKDFKNEYAKCALFPIEDGKFLVTGKITSENYYYCSTARISSSMCGKNATKYKRKYKKNE